MKIYLVLVLALVGCGSKSNDNEKKEIQIPKSEEKSSETIPEVSTLPEILPTPSPVASIEPTPSPTPSVEPSPSVAPTPEPSFECKSEMHVFSDPNQWGRNIKALDDAAKGKSPELAFIGDSITAGWVTSTPWNDFYVNRSVNFGIGGDNSMHVLWRLEHGMLDSLAAMPKVIILGIGFNDYATGKGVDEVAKRITCLVERIKEKSPTSKILQVNVLPSGDIPTYKTRVFFNLVNPIIKKSAEELGVTFFEFGKEFLDADGNMLPGMTKDLVHPADPGYIIWADKMNPVIDSLLGEQYEE